MTSKFCHPGSHHSENSFNPFIACPQSRWNGNIGGVPLLSTDTTRRGQYHATTLFQFDTYDTPSSQIIVYTTIERIAMEKYLSIQIFSHHLLFGLVYLVSSLLLDGTIEFVVGRYLFLFGQLLSHYRGHASILVCLVWTFELDCVGRFHLATRTTTAKLFSQYLVYSSLLSGWCRDILLNNNHHHVYDIHNWITPMGLVDHWRILCFFLVL